MKRVSLTAILLMSVLFCFSQNSYRRGYILPGSTDTVFGFIRAESEEKMSLSIQFSKDGVSDGKTYTPEELDGFGLDKSFYRSLRFIDDRGDSPVSRIQFCRLKESGKIQLYAIQEGFQFFYIALRDSTTYFLYNTQYEGMGTVAKKGNYQNILFFLSTECENSAFDLQRTPYTEAALGGFVHSLNRCLAPQTAVSFRQERRFEKELVVFAGGLPVTSASQFTTAMNLRFTDPIFSRKVSLNVGLFFSNTVNTDKVYYYGQKTVYTHRRLLSIPLTFRYTFTEGRIAPYFYLGFGIANIHTTAPAYAAPISGRSQGTGASVIFGGGVDIRLLQQLYLTIDERYELFFHNPAAGLSYRFKFRRSTT